MTNGLEVVAAAAGKGDADDAAATVRASTLLWSPVPIATISRRGCSCGRFELVSENVSVLALLSRPLLLRLLSFPLLLLSSPSELTEVLLAVVSLLLSLPKHFSSSLPLVRDTRATPATDAGAAELPASPTAATAMVKRRLRHVARVPNW